jgi:hypothetical protein
VDGRRGIFFNFVCKATSLGGDGEQPLSGPGGMRTGDRRSFWRPHKMERGDDKDVGEKVMIKF